MTPAPPSAARQAVGLTLACVVLLLVAGLGGGWIALGRVDPLLAVPGAGWAAMVGALAGRAAPSLQLVGASGLAAFAILALVQRVWAGWIDWLPTTAAAFAVAVALVLAGLLAASARGVSASRRYLTVGLMVVGAWGWQIAAFPLVARAYDPSPIGEQPRVVVVTSLPLFATSRGDLNSLLGGEVTDAPAVEALRRHFELLPAANPDPHILAEGSTLLLAHPGPLAPEALVAIDGWVRGGGRAVILADALLVAEPPYPLGDPRNPPVSTLLDPLLAHWGAAIEPATAGPRVVMDGRERLALLTAGEVMGRSGTCRQTARGLIARCRIGRGQVVIVGDADMLDPAMWSGAPDRAGAVSWRSANIAWLATQLHPQSVAQHRGLARPIWVR